MNARALYDRLMAAGTIAELEAALGAYRRANGPKVSEIPVGRRPNNRGQIEVATDPGRSLVERVTNAHDAILELAHERHRGVPQCDSPREAAAAWLGVPERAGLAGVAPARLRGLASATVVRLEPGEDRQSRLLSVIDQGIGIAPGDFADTILSLNESNKIQKLHLAGTYGQGGSSTFAFCRYAVLASRRDGSDAISFTVVRYKDLPAQEYKTGSYVYLAKDRAPLTVAAGPDDMPYGTVVRHFGYDLSKYSADSGPRSLSGVLGRTLFDPVSPVRLEDRVHGFERIIPGARGALNAAEGVDGGPGLDHHVPLFQVPLEGAGSIGVEYWALARAKGAKGEAQRAKLADHFVTASKPVIFTHYGQNQGEVTGRLLKEDAGLPYLQMQGRLICHVNCDRLSSQAKRQLFVSTREQAREGALQERICEELAHLLRRDDELVRLNEEARRQSMRARDEAARQQMRRRVARLLRVGGRGRSGVEGAQASADGKDARRKPQPIALAEPPTYIRIVGDPDAEIAFRPGQRRYLRIETNADSSYHHADDPGKSRIRIAVGLGLEVRGTSPLEGGRMRVGVQCAPGAVPGARGSIRISLRCDGFPELSDARRYCVVRPAADEAKPPKIPFPDFEVIAVPGPADENWGYICAGAEDEDIGRHASGSIMDQDVLYIYYSEVFPHFIKEARRFEKQSESAVKSFKDRYEMWLAAHALLMHQEGEGAAEGVAEEAREEMRRQERCRHAVVATIIAGQEVRSGALADAGEEPSA